jgi:hypothetical protein
MYLVGVDLNFFISALKENKALQRSPAMPWSQNVLPASREILPCPADWMRTIKLCAKLHLFYSICQVLQRKTLFCSKGLPSSFFS